MELTHESRNQWHVIRENERLIVIKCETDLSDGRTITFGDYIFSNYEIVYTKVNFIEAMQYIQDLTNGNL